MKQAIIDIATQQKAGSLVRQLIVAKETPEEDLLRVEHRLDAPHLQLIRSFSIRRDSSSLPSSVRMNPSPTARNDLRRDL
jgi:hypothetical protein